VWSAKIPGRFSLGIYIVEDWKNMRGDMKAVVKRMLEFLLHFIASVFNEFLYSGTNSFFLNFAGVTLVFILQRDCFKHFFRS